MFVVLRRSRTCLGAFIGNLRPEDAVIMFTRTVYNQLVGGVAQSV